MKGIFLALVCAFTLTSATRNSNGVPVNEFGCPFEIITGVDFFLPHERYCDRYYVCIFGFPYLSHCKDKLVFDIENNECRRKADVDCGDRTIPVGEGKPESEENSVEEKETRRPLFGYDDPSLAEEICAEKGSDSILISHEVCSKYYQCNHGHAAALNCPNNLYYNPKKGYCDWQSNVNCTNVGVIDPNWSHAERECSNGKSLVSHEKYCNWFYHCGPQGPTAKSCQKGLVFQPEIQGCNWPKFVNCGDKIIKPEVTQPPVTQPPVTQPAVTEPAATEPAATEPEVTKPEVVEPEVPEPEEIEPEVTEPLPEEIEPEVTEPAPEPEPIPEPEPELESLPEPEVPEPEVPEPEVPEPEAIVSNEEVDGVIVHSPEVSE